MKDCPVSLVSNGDYWTATWRNDAGRVVRRGLGPKRTTQKREAVAMCRQLAVKHALAPSARAGSRMPQLREWLDRYLENREGEITDQTLAGHRKTCNYLLRYFSPTLPIDKITRNTTADWRIWMGKQGITETTVCGHVRTAKVIFKRAVQRDLIPFDPFDRLHGADPKPKHIDRHYVSLDVFNALLAACPDHQWRALFGLCRLAGLRRGEALRMKWNQVDWYGSRLRVEDTKRGRLRLPRIEPDLYAILSEAHTVARPDEDQIWTHSRGARGNIYNQIAAIIEAAGLQNWPKPLQSLRSSCDTDWKQRYPEYVVDLWIGHSREVSRDHYLTVPEELYETKPL